MPYYRPLIAVLCLIFTLVIGFDVLQDFQMGVSRYHLLTEFTLLLAAMIALWLVFTQIRQLWVKRLALANGKITNLATEAIHWRKKALMHIEGLSQFIDAQLVEWNLSPSEKDIAFLLLKGLSLAEISQIRKVSEKTIKQQSQSIYRKAKLAGRAELAAFFLEDLLAPRNPQSI